MANKKNNIDWGLKFYLDVLKLHSLHFGLWNDGDGLTLDNMRRAQDRYTEELLAMIPAGVKTVLDAGSGTGAQSALLIKKGYEVTALNPDSFQSGIFRERLGDRVELQQVKFEDFRPDRSYDLILMSESSQYMETKKMADRAYETLKDGGRLLVSDYFRKSGGDKFYSTCRIKDRFLKELSDAGFELCKEENVTRRVIPTLAMGRKIYCDYAFPTIKIIAGYLDSNYPAAAGVLKRIFSKKLKKVSYYLFEHSLDKTDTDKFMEKMEYLFLIFRKAEVKK